MILKLILELIKPQINPHNCLFEDTFVLLITAEYCSVDKIIRREKNSFNEFSLVEQIKSNRSFNEISLA